MYSINNNEKTPLHGVKSIASPHWIALALGNVEKQQWSQNPFAAVRTIWVETMYVS